MSTPELIAAETAVLAAIDLGGAYASARLIVYDINNLKLAEFAMSFPAFPVPSDVTTDANVIQQALAASAGLPDHFEITDRSGTVRLNGSIGQQGSGANIEMLPLQPCVQGQGLALDAIAYTQVDLDSGEITGVLQLLAQVLARPAEAPKLRQIEWIDLVRHAEGPLAFANRDWELEYEFGSGGGTRSFYRRGAYTT